MARKRVVYVGGAGYVYALKTSDGTVLWETELKSGWFKFGSDFVSLLEEEKVLHAFSYGKYYAISKRTGSILVEGPEVPKLKARASVFAGDPVDSTGGMIVAGGSGGDGGEEGGGDGGDGGGDGGGD
jgi:outer membrane protein assembly factor BamB